MGIDAEGAKRRWHAKLLVVVSLPLPLPAYRGSVEFIVLNGIMYCALCIVLGFLIGGDRFSLLTHDRPASRPVDRVQVDDAAIGFLVLEMQEPVLTILRVYPAALMRAVDAGLTLCQHLLVLVRAKGRLRAHSQLKASRHAAGRTHNPVPAVALIELRSFAGAVLRAVAVEDDDGLADGLGTVSRQFANREYRRKLRA